MKSATSQSRLIIGGVVGVALLVAIYLILFSDNDVRDEQPISAIAATNAWVRATAADNEELNMAGVTSAAYMEISNHSDSARRLMSVSAMGVGMVQIHQTVVKDDIARMVHQADGVVISAGETVMLEPGGLHIMLMNLEVPLIAGEEMDLTLYFDDDSAIVVPAQIRSE